jgi:hypothetical protein
MQYGLAARGPLSICVDACTPLDIHDRSANRQSSHSSSSLSLSLSLASWQYYIGGVITSLCEDSLDHCVMYVDCHRHRHWPLDRQTRLCDTSHHIISSLFSLSRFRITGYSNQEGWDFQKYNVWNIRNSWGEDWGYGGYLYVQRGSNLCGTFLSPIAWAPTARSHSLVSLVVRQASATRSPFPWCKARPLRPLSFHYPLSRTDRSAEPYSLAGTCALATCGNARRLLCEHHRTDLEFHFSLRTVRACAPASPHAHGAQNETRTITSWPLAAWFARPLPCVCRSVRSSLLPPDISAMPARSPPPPRHSAIAHTTPHRCSAGPGVGPCLCGGPVRVRPHTQSTSREISKAPKDGGDEPGSCRARRRGEARPGAVHQDCPRPSVCVVLPLSAHMCTHHGLRVIDSSGRVHTLT